MWTRRKKQNLIFLLLGLLLGALVCCIIFYFNVLKGFMRDSISTIQELKAQRDTVQVVKTYIYPHSGVPAEDTALVPVEAAGTMDSTNESAYADDEIILMDVCQATATIAVMQMTDDSTFRKEDRPQYLRVEQWENPMHFIGYKKLGDQLIIYGLNIDEIELYRKNEVLYLKFGEASVSLKESSDFTRFPASFLHQVNFN